MEVVLNNDTWSSYLPKFGFDQLQDCFKLGHPKCNDFFKGWWHQMTGIFLMIIVIKQYLIIIKLRLTCMCCLHCTCM